MKEFIDTIREDLIEGLRSHNEGYVKYLGCADLRNMKPGKSGLIEVDDLTNPFSGVSVSWPFPQVFMGESYQLLCNATEIFSFDSDWTLTSEISGLTTGSAWEFVDYGDFFLLVNGSVIVYLNRGTIDTPVSPAEYASMVSSSTFPRCATMCNLNGQLIGGNVKTSWHDCGTNSVIWSDIGTIDFTPEPNKAGYRANMRWSGTVVLVKKLGNRVIVYGSRGVDLMTPAQTVFGFTPLSGKGISAAGCVGGDDNKHLILDNSCDLILYTPSNVVNLGFKEFMQDLTLANVRISYDQLADEFYISDGTFGFLLTENNKLTRIHQLVSTVFNTDTTSYSIAKSDTDRSMLIEFSPKDFNLRSQKTMMVAEIGGQGLSDIEFGVKTKFNQTQFPHETQWKFVNSDGACYPIISGTDFIIKLRSESPNDIKIDYLQVGLKHTDKRTKRGAYLRVMLVLMLPEQVAHHWPVVRLAVENSLPPIAGESPFKMQNILQNILLEKMQCWAELDEMGKLGGIVITEITQDDATKTSSLLIYCGASFVRTTNETWVKGIATLSKYARSKNCGQILLYTKISGIVEMFKRAGAEVYSFLSLPLGEKDDK